MQWVDVKHLQGNVKSWVEEILDTRNNVVQTQETTGTLHKEKIIWQQFFQQYDNVTEKSLTDVCWQEANTNPPLKQIYQTRSIPLWSISKLVWDAIVPTNRLLFARSKIVELCSQYSNTPDGLGFKKDLKT